MAPRKSATKTQARERARRAAAESMARQQRLLELGEEFFLAQGEEAQIFETAERRIDEIRTQAQKDAAQSRHAQAQVVAAMKGERAGVTEIGRRLELSATEVRALLKETPARAPSSTESVTAGDEPVADGQVHPVQSETVSV